MAESSPPRFQMVGARSAILDGPVAEPIEQHIEAIENALESVPDFAFDLSKGLVDTVCKTVLADIGQPASTSWDSPKLLRETTNRLKLLPDDNPTPAKTRDSVEKTIRGMLQTIQGLCELRNNYGMVAHGRDAFAARLGLRQATLAAQAADTIVAFLYRTHREASSQTPGARVYYEDHPEFNEEIDRDYEPIRLGEVELIPSQVLFYTDLAAYRAALQEFIAARNGEGDGEGLDEQNGKSEEKGN
ncbi:MAG: abortive infection family protein [Caldilineaceae bacterium SB0675_bin_29]|uniref:Abortive infection family protein n=1 Tax=Caldilineaceae bacterium SB0675_bin_29 TaxID=2605266 RepID=A0A6B1G4N4_9CHLR|nr:abortive infection family protein [Caldilineaceae bacterium SB0675_bin_29]